MKIAIPNRDELVSKFLTPLSRINDTCVIKLEEKRFSSTVATNDGTLIFHSTFNLTDPVEESNSLNIPHVSKLIKVLNVIPENHIVLNVQSNHLQYSSEQIKFKYHLLEDGIINSPAIGLDKLKQIKFDTSFNLTANSLSNLIRGSSFASETDKIYISSDEDGNVYGELTDHKKSNVDSIRYKVADECTGDIIAEPLPVNFELFRIISNSKIDMFSVHISVQLNVMLLKGSSENVNMTYVVAGLAE